MKPNVNSKARSSYSRKGMLFLQISLLWAAVVFPGYSQDTPGEQNLPDLNYDRIQADSAFRDGVLWLHRGRVNDAILSFQQALSFDSADTLARTWLGRGYLLGGYNEAALRELQQVSDAGSGGIALESLIETLELRRGFVREVPEDTAFFPLASFSLRLPGGGGTAQLGSPQGDSQQPRTLPLPGGIAIRTDGWYWVANVTGNSIQLYDANGTLRRSITGGLQGLQGPLDIISLSEPILGVTSFRSDEIVLINSDSGAEIMRMGEPGIGPGQLMGPQFLAYDPEGYIFVSDYGNQRIQKFSLEGEFLFSIGGVPGLDVSSLRFNRLHGVLWYEDSLWVLDREGSTGVLYEIDGSGNVLSTFRDDRLQHGEGLSVFPGEEPAFLITTRTTIYRWDPVNRLLSEVYRAQDEDARFFKSGIDPNGNILITDSYSRQVSIVSRLSGLYSGIHVQINKINADNFPRVTIDFSVQDRLGRPVLGLDTANFFLTEADSPVENPELISRGYQLPYISTQIILPPLQDPQGEPVKSYIESQVQSLFSTLQGSDSMDLILGGETPTVVLESSDSDRSARLQRIDSLVYQGRDAFDLGVRLAVNRLIRQDGIRHLIYLNTDTAFPEDAFSTYGIEELRGYMVNNEVAFSVVSGDENAIDPALAYLVRETGGSFFTPSEIMDANRVRNILADDYPGRYIYEYRSRLNSDFGRRYLPVEVEVRYLTKSGRDEAGYFSPLIF
ncbi:NHL repeat-containing protein [Spirochaeta lutea]|nr:hypothetical protein [Spirochaeta lutea]